MIEVIKHGKTKFTATCANCGCEFNYEVEDIVDGKVACPDCHKKFPHIMTSGYISAPIYYPPNCRVVEYAPKTGYPPDTIWFNTTTNANEANTTGTLLGDVHTTEKDLEIQQVFKDQMSKKMAIPCADKE
jgi:hypothetical protein